MEDKTENSVDNKVRNWLIEIDLAEKEEKDWRRDAEEALKVYTSTDFAGSGDDKKRKDTFNILWSNVEVLRPSLYNSMPRPDIRRRYRDKDKLGQVISELMERCSTYTLDCNDFDSVMIAAVLDHLLTGRAVTRIRYNPVFTKSPTEDDEELAYEEVTFEQVQWDDFTRSAGKCWDDVTWIKFDHKLTKDEIEEKFPDFKDKVSYDTYLDEDNKDEGEQFKRCKVYEIWDKEERKVIFIAPSYKDSVLLEEDDPLNLQGFFPIPTPLLAVENSTSLVPVTEYSMYETLAKELEKITKRIGLIINGLRLRGIYDSRLSEIEKLFDAGDNKFVPAENVAALLDSGGVEKAIWELPIDKYATVLTQLYQYRNSLMQSIYEVTGISDIIRGATNPNETLGAQEIKANFGTQRLQRRQKEVQRYARDLVRLATEVMAEKFSNETLSLMSGLEFPTDEIKQQAQQAVQYKMNVAQFTGQPPQIDPKLQELLEKPSWEEIREVLSSDMLREFRIDIETDSTVQAQLQDDQKNITELLSGITQFIGGVAPAVQSGYMPLEVAKELMLAAVRRFKLGRQVEDALEKIEQPPPQPDPEQKKMEVEMKMEQERFKMEQQDKQADAQIKQQEAKQEMRVKNAELALREKELNMEAVYKEREHQLKMEELERKAESDLLKHNMMIEASKVKKNEQRQQP